MRIGRGERTSLTSKSSTLPAGTLFKWNSFPYGLPILTSQTPARLYSTSPPNGRTHGTLTHLTPSGHAQMVSVSAKEPTLRKAIAQCRVNFSKHDTLALVRANQMKKGDVLQIARIAGIMAAKRTSDLIPLCHPLPLDHIQVEAEAFGEASSPDAGIRITATVTCHGKTGVEMEALTAASVAAMTVYDMCKAVDRAMSIDALCIVHKEGGQSGTWALGRDPD